MIIFMTNCFVTKIETSLAQKIKTDLIEKGFTISIPPHTIFSAAKPGICINFYLSGKFTVQGKDKDDFILFYLEPEILQNFDYLRPKTKIVERKRIGCDEAGKGDFFGPLCVAAFYFDPSQTDFLLSLGVNDSKVLQDSKISSIAAKLKESCEHEVICIFPKKYNELYEKFQNLNLLLGWAHVKAMTTLSERVFCDDVLLDQFVKPPFMSNLLKKSSKNHIKLTERTKAEEDIAVACASILARDAFVKGMEKLSSEYGMVIPKGASKNVLLAGKKFLSLHGKETLSYVAKVHFKTYKEVLDLFF
jgi:ribonuclease HIII